MLHRLRYSHFYRELYCAQHTVVPVNDGQPCLVVQYYTAATNSYINDTVQSSETKGLFRSPVYFSVVAKLLIPGGSLFLYEVQVNLVDYRIPVSLNDVVSGVRIYWKSQSWAARLPVERTCKSTSQTPRGGKVGGRKGRGRSLLVRKCE